MTSAKLAPSQRQSSIFSGTQGFLFDLDGTLIQQRIDFARMRQAVWDIVEAFGVPVGPLASMYVLELIEHVSALLAAQVSLAAAEEQQRAFVAQTRQAIVDIELEAAEGAEVFQGVPEMLQVLADRGWRVGIVTRNCRPAVERVLARWPLHHDVLLTRDDVARAKPDPAHLLTALGALGVSAAQAVMCGDHPMDVLAGQRVGALTVGVLSPGLTPDYFADVHPDLVVSRVTDLLAHLPR